MKKAIPCAILVICTKKLSMLLFSEELLLL